METCTPRSLLRRRSPFIIIPRLEDQEGKSRTIYSSCERARKEDFPRQNIPGAIPRESSEPMNASHRVLLRTSRPRKSGTQRFPSPPRCARACDTFCPRIDSRDAAREARDNDHPTARACCCVFTCAAPCSGAGPSSGAKHRRPRRPGVRLRQGGCQGVRDGGEGRLRHALGRGASETQAGDDRGDYPVSWLDVRRSSQQFDTHPIHIYTLTQSKLMLMCP